MSLSNIIRKDEYSFETQKAQLNKNGSMCHFNVIHKIIARKSNTGREEIAWR